MQTKTQNASQEALPFEPPYLHFLQAWQCAVEATGQHLFSCQVNELDEAVHHHQLTPDLDKIRRAIPNKSLPDAAFLAALISFFNAQEGQKLLNKTGCTFGGLILLLNPTQRRILTDLITHYRGW